jgi:hypothetical protein
MKYYILAGLAAAVLAGGLITAAPPASAGCQNADWSAHPFSQMCDSAVDEGGSWIRCLIYHTGGPYSPSQTDCYPMSPGNPPAGDPVLATPPTHIDP